MNAEPTRSATWPAAVLTGHAHRIVYATIVLIVALGRFDVDEDPASQTLTDLILVAFGPLLVLAIAHAFADALGRPFTTTAADAADDRRSDLISGLVYPAVAVPIVLIALVITAAGQQPLLAAQISQTACWISLGVWGFAGARRRGRSLGRQIATALAYVGLGFLVALTEVVLGR